MTPHVERPTLLDLPPPETPEELEQMELEERRERTRALRLARWHDLERSVTETSLWCYNAGVRVLQTPFYVLDLLDKNGKPDHSKLGPFIVSQELIAIQAYDVIINHHQLQATIVMICAVLSFASASLMRMLIKKSELKMSSETKITADVKEIIERRVSERGLEATP